MHSDHVVIATQTPWPDRSVVAREQARALLRRGFRVSVVAPASSTAAFAETVRDIEFIAADYRADARYRWLAGRSAFVHLMIEWDTPSYCIELATACEILTVPIHSRTAYAIGIAALVSRSMRRGRAPIATANRQLRRLSGRLRPLPYGYSSWVAPSSGPGDRQKFFYQGVVSSHRRFATMVRAFSRLRRRAPGVELHIATTSDVGPRLLPPGVRAHHEPSGSLLNDLAHECGTHLAFVPETLRYAGQPALKVLDAAAAGRVIVSTRTTALREQAALIGRSAICGADREEAFAALMHRALVDFDDLSAAALVSAGSFRAAWSWDRVVDEHWLALHAGASR